MQSLLGGAAVACGLVLLAFGRARPMTAAVGLQGWAVAAAIAWEGLEQRGAQPLLLALIAAATASVFPIALRRLAPCARPEPIGWTVPVLGLALVALGAVLGSQIARGPERESVTLALCIALLGVLAVVARHGFGARLSGFVMLWNGAAIAAAHLSDSPIIFSMLVSYLALPAAALGAMALPQSRTAL